MRHAAFDNLMHTKISIYMQILKAILYPHSEAFSTLSLRANKCGISKYMQSVLTCVSSQILMVLVILLNGC